MTPKRHRKKWTDEEIEFLRNPEMDFPTNAKVARVLGRSTNAVSQKKLKLGIKVYEKRDMPISYYASSLGISYKYLRELIHRYSVEKTTFKLRKGQVRYYVSAEDIWDLVRRFPNRFDLSVYERYSVIPEPPDIDNIIRLSIDTYVDPHEWRYKEVQHIKDNYPLGRSLDDLSKDLRIPKNSVASKVHNLIRVGELKSYDYWEVDNRLDRLFSYYKEGHRATYIASQLGVPVTKTRRKINYLREKGKL